MIWIFNPLLISQNQMSKEKVRNYNQIQLNIANKKTQKNLTKKDNQNEVLETNFVPHLGKITKEINLFN